MVKKYITFLIIIIMGAGLILLLGLKGSYALVSSLKDNPEPVLKALDIPENIIGSHIEVFTVDHSLHPVLISTDKNGKEITVTSLDTLSSVNTLTGFNRVSGLAVSDRHNLLLVFDEGRQVIHEFLLSDILLKSDPDPIITLHSRLGEKIVSVSISEKSENPLILIGVEAGDSNIIRLVSKGGIDEGVIDIKNANPRFVSMDNKSDIVYLSDPSVSNVKKYKTSGLFLGNLVETVDGFKISKSIPYYCSSLGYIIALDENDESKSLKVFNGESGEHLGNINLNLSSGIKSFEIIQSKTERFPNGAIIVLSISGEISVFDLKDVSGATNLSLCLDDSSSTLPVIKNNLASVPEHLTARRIGKTEALLSWKDRSSPASSYGYIILRDGAEIGTSKINEFVDSNLKESLSYTYEIRAVSPSGIISKRSEPFKLPPASSDDEPEKADSELKLLSTHISSITDSSAKITWGTKYPAHGEIYFGTDTNSWKVFPNKTDNVTSHEIRLTDLSPATSYYYKVNVVDSKGQIFETLTQSFTTLNAKNETDTRPPSVTLVPKSVLVPQGNGYLSSLYASLVSNESAKIYFTLDGSDPEKSGTRKLFSADFPVEKTTTIKYFAVDNAGNSSSGEDVLRVDSEALNPLSYQPTIKTDLKSPHELVDPAFIYDDDFNGQEYGVAVYEAQIPEEDLLFVSHFKAGRVEVWNISNEKVVTLITNFINPGGLAVNSREGVLYVADRGDYSIKKYFIRDLRAGNIQPSLIIKNTNENEDPVSISIFEEGNRHLLYAILKTNSGRRVKAFDSNGNSVISWDKVSDNYEFILGDSENEIIFVTDREENSIKAFSKNGQLKKDFGSHRFSGDPKGLGYYSCGSEGYLLSVDNAKDEIEVFNRKTFDHLADFSVRRLDGVTDLAVLNSYHPKYTDGAIFFPVKSSYVESVSWNYIAKAIDASVCARGIN